MTEAQTWTAIGVLSAALLGGVTLVTTVVMRSITGQIVSLRNELNARFETVDARFDAVRSEMKGGFDRVDAKFESLEKDVQALAPHVFGADRP